LFRIHLNALTPTLSLTGEGVRTHLCLFLVGVAVIVAARPARANSGGIAGQSGKQGRFCNSCHGGGIPPEVALVGPNRLMIGEAATFRFEVRSTGPNQRAAGFNVAASGGMLAVIDGQGTRFARQVGELTHAGPKGNDDDGVARWEFLWTAPDTPGSQRLFGAGNSVNLNGQSSGDRAATTTLDVDVVEAFDTPTATPTPTELPPTATPTVTSTRAPTRTFGPVPCVGDCDDGHSVTVNELVLGVNISLGNTAITACVDFDANGDGRVAINELIAGVNAALGTCVS
jgi:hypothetical protein